MFESKRELKLYQALNNYLKTRTDLSESHQYTFQLWLNRLKARSVSATPRRVCEAMVLWAENVHEQVECPEKTRFHELLYSLLPGHYPRVIKAFGERKQFLDALEQQKRIWTFHDADEQSNFSALLDKIKTDVVTLEEICFKLVKWIEEETTQQAEIFVFSEHQESVANELRQFLQKHAPKAYWQVMPHLDRKEMPRFSEDTSAYTNYFASFFIARKNPTLMKTSDYVKTVFPQIPKPEMPKIVVFPDRTGYNMGQ